jgi:hypothetical protein
VSVDRVVARFSCGAASAISTKIAIERYGDRLEIVNAFLAAESPDNRRFLAECERWFGRSITVLRDTKYAAEPLNVWSAKRFIAGSKGAPCSKELKGKILDAFADPADGIPLVLGYTSDEAHRIDNFLDANAGAVVIAPLVEEGIDKDECFARVARAGLTLPLPYRQGFHNSNCLKCPRGGLGYWKHIDRFYPDNYEEVAQLQDVLGPGSWFLSDRRGGKRVRLSLRMLREIDEPRWRLEDEPPVQCGGLCELSDVARPAELAL